MSNGKFWREEQEILKNEGFEVRLGGLEATKLSGLTRPEGPAKVQAKL